MARATRTIARQRKRAHLSPTLTLAFWRLRKTWGLLLVTGLGMVMAVILACTVPLYSQVAMSAGLRGVLNASAQNADMIVRGSSTRISSPIISTLTRQLNQEVEHHLGSYIASPQFSLEQIFSFPTTHERMGLVGTSMDQAASHLRLVAGRLPRATSDALEIAVTPQTASLLHLTYQATVGSVLKVNLDFLGADQTLTQRSFTVPLHLVGIFTLNHVDDPFWHGNNFEVSQVRDEPPLYPGLVANEAILAAMTHIGNQAAVDHLVLTTTSSLNWYYRFDTSRMAIDQLDDILNNIYTVKVDNANNTALDQSPFIDQAETYLPSDLLEQYRSRIAVAQIPIAGLLVLILGLVLFFVFLMIDLLVDRQSEAIALLRSRGASQSQIFGSLLTQGLLLGLLALLVGPPLAIPLARLLVQHLFPAADQSVLSLLSTDPQIVWEVTALALLSGIVICLAMVLAFRRAVRLDALSLRREAARSTRRPFWQRLHLDSAAALLALTGYGFSLYLTRSGALDAQSSLLLLSPLTLFEIVFLILAGMLFFLRFFPHLLQGGARLAVHNPGAAPLLALAQMARAPALSVRMILLLALATGFALFTLIFTASQSQRILDVAAYQTGAADFSGSVPTALFAAGQLADETAAYRHLPGVLSATLGYTASPTAGDTLLSIPINFSAVDADTYAQTATWTQQDAAQPLASLMAQLSRQRASAISHNVVPALVDAATWNALHLTPGAHFRLNFSLSDYADRLNFVALAEVQNIPTSGNSALAGVMVDFQSYAAVYAKISSSADGFAIPLNFVWLRTHDDAASLLSVREALNQGGLQLNPLYDRRAIIAALSQEPLYLGLMGVLLLGAATVLLLALVGNLLASWLRVRGRLTSFAVLRALGSTPAQMLSILAWEQGIIYLVSLLLGIVFGALFSAIAVPALVFTSVVPSGIGSDLSSAQFYALQSVPPFHLVIPNTLGIGLGILVIICVVALGMMVRIVSRLSLSQTLRLNED